MSSDSYITSYEFEGRTIEVHKFHFLIVEPHELAHNLQAPKDVLAKLRTLVTLSDMKLSATPKPTIEQPVKVVEEYKAPAAKKGVFGLLGY